MQNRDQSFLLSADRQTSLGAPLPSQSNRQESQPANTLPSSQRRGAVTGDMASTRKPLSQQVDIRGKKGLDRLDLSPDTEELERGFKKAIQDA